MKNGSIMLSMGIFNATCDVIFNVVLLKAIGLEGLALATSFLQIAVAIVFWIRLPSKLGPLRAEAVA